MDAAVSGGVPRGQTVRSQTTKLLSNSELMSGRARYHKWGCVVPPVAKPDGER